MDRMEMLKGFLADLVVIAQQQERLITLLEEIKLDSIEQTEVLHRTFALLDHVAGVYLSNDA